MKRGMGPGFVVLGTVAGLLLSACGSTPAGGSPGAASPQTPSATAPSAFRSLPAPRSVPAGYRWLHSDRAGLDVAVPKQWESVEPEVLAGDLQDYADRFGVTVEEARQAVTSGLEAVVRNADGTDEVRLLVIDQVLTPATLEKTLEASGSTSIDVTPYPSPTGFNVIARFDVQTPSGPMACRAMVVWLKNPARRTALIQACATETRTADDLATSVFQGTRFF